MNPSKYAFRVVDADGDLCSEHRTEAAAVSMARRLQRMGTKPAGFYRVEPIAKV